MDVVLLIVLVVVSAAAVAAAYVYKLSKKDPEKLNELAADAKELGNRIEEGLDKVSDKVRSVGDRLP